MKKMRGVLIISVPDMGLGLGPCLLYNDVFHVFATDPPENKLTSTNFSAKRPFKSEMRQK